MEERISVLIADDNKVFADGVKEFLRTKAEILTLRKMGYRLEYSEGGSLAGILENDHYSQEIQWFYVLKERISQASLREGGGPRSGGRSLRN